MVSTLATHPAHRIRAPDSRGYFGPELPWQLMRLPPDRFTLVNVQKSSAPVAVFARQIGDVPAWAIPLAIWI
jgi:hypothetical protein